MSFFVVRWKTYGYVARSRIHPYQEKSNHVDVKRWKTRKNAQRWLDGRAPSYAATCVIEEVREVRNQ